MKIGIKDISELTGYSRATVSNALNNKPGVNPLTATKIIRAAQQLGYVKTTKITTIRLILHKSHGLVIDNSSFYSQMIHGAEVEAKANGMDTILCVIDRKRNEFHSKLQTSLSDVSSAIILVGTEMLEEDFLHYKNYRNPIVVMDGWSNTLKFDCVQTNNIESAYDAAIYLVENGHHKIGYLKSKIRTKNFSQRSMGFQHALRKSGFPLQSKYIISVAPSLDSAYKDMQEWLKTHRNLPTAFFAENDSMALGAMQAIREIGYSIPQDVSIIGFEDLQITEKTKPGLTTIRVFNEEMGRIAVRKVIESMRSGSIRTRTKTQVYTEFVKRDSILDINKI